jgi:AcrR family transcriptional regulator
LPQPKRVRRTPEDARRVILDAAEAIVARTGPGGLRLQEVAKAAGVSHPAILHHFENREGLIFALNRRTLEALGEALRVQMGALRHGDGGALHAAFAAWRGGFAQRVVWFLQAGGSSPDWQIGPGLFDEMAERLHALRCSLAPPGREPDRVDSRAIVHLVTVAALGDALIGPRLRRAPDDAAEDEARGRFEDWLSALIDEHVEGAAPRQEP